MESLIYMDGTIITLVRKLTLLKLILLHELGMRTVFSCMGYSCLTTGVPQYASTESGYWVAKVGFCVAGDDVFGSENPAELWKAKPDVLESSVATGNLSGVMLQHAKRYINKCHELVLIPENPVYTDKAYSEKEGEMQTDDMTAPRPNNRFIEVKMPKKLVEYLANTRHDTGEMPHVVPVSASRSIVFQVVE
ncbi:hypothetical protein BTVI_121294 [Pitangus sulphuratus]|nr:hypothetical protein BTVI_121294 [Pitangus sulphuratus]